MPYRPSEEDLRRFKCVLARNTPSREAYEGYAEKVRVHLGYCSLAPPRLRSRDGRVCAVTKTCLYHSELFQQPYLVQYVEDLWFDQTAPGSDAIASVNVSDSHEVPPLVLVPDRRKRSRSKAFVSILEHEVVHVNQAIRGCFPQRKEHRSLKPALTAFYSIVRSEFDANTLQLTRWPKLFPHARASLEHWCALRGWSFAVEEVVAGGLCPPSLVPALLDALVPSLGLEFARAGISSGLAPWFAEELPFHVKVAATLVVERDPTMAASGALHATGDWLTARGGF
jgi:hypothetical protein